LILAFMQTINYLHALEGIHLLRCNLLRLLLLLSRSPRNLRLPMATKGITLPNDQPNLHHLAIHETTIHLGNLLTYIESHHTLEIDLCLLGHHMAPTIGIMEPLCTLLLVDLLPQRRRSPGNTHLLHTPLSHINPLSHMTTGVEIVTGMETENIGTMIETTPETETMTTETGSGTEIETESGIETIILNRDIHHITATPHGLLATQLLPQALHVIHLMNIQ